MERVWAPAFAGEQRATALGGSHDAHHKAERTRGWRVGGGTLMPTYRISIVNKDFTATEDIDAADVAAARTEALKGALQIGTDEICEGKMFFGAEISIQGNGKATERLMIAIGATSLR